MRLKLSIQQLDGKVMKVENVNSKTIWMLVSDTVYNRQCWAKGRLRLSYLWTFSMAATSARASKLKKAGSSCGTVLLSASSPVGWL